MNLALTSTGLSLPGYKTVQISKDNVDVMFLADIPNESLDNIYVNRCIHLLEPKLVKDLLTVFLLKLKKGGKITVNIVDMYTVCHKFHRREVSENDLNSTLYENGQKNCLSTLTILSLFAELGMKKESFYIEEVYAIMEFSK